MASGQFSMSAEEDRLERLSATGDPLVRLEAAIDREAFRPVLDAAMAKERKGPGGRPPYDYVAMLKVLVAQQLHNPSDDGCEFLARPKAAKALRWMANG